MAFGRVDSTIYLHGAVANGHLQSLVGGPCSLTFTLVDGLVFARSAFHHSMNYRCAVVIGQARLVEDRDEKHRALVAVLEHAAPGRLRECVGMTEGELRGTRVVAVDVFEAVAKRRLGPPVDAATDVTRGDTFAGVVPLETRAATIERAPGMTRPLPVPPSVQRFAERYGSAPIIEAGTGDILLSTDPSRVDRAWLHRVLAEQSYWADGIDESTLLTGLRHSLQFGAYLEDRQVGFCRVLTDCSRIAYLGDVFVDETHRGRGLGTALVRFALVHPAVKRCGRVLLGTRDAQTFYAKFGFEAPAHSYLVRRQ